jgi:hypothetical protein
VGMASGAAAHARKRGTGGNKK